MPEGPELARLTSAKLHIVSAYTPTAARVVGEKASGEYSVGPDFKVDAVLAGTISNLRAEGIEIGGHAPKGDPADAIVEVAVREGADLIVLGDKGMQGARRVLGSIPNKVSHRAPMRPADRPRRPSDLAGRRHPRGPHVDCARRGRNPLRLEQQPLPLTLRERPVRTHYLAPRARPGRGRTPARSRRNAAPRATRSP